MDPSGKPPAAPKVEATDELEVDVSWDEVAAAAPASATIPAPPPETATDDVAVDVFAASRAHNTAAAMGRAPAAAPTAKIKPFQLAEALARATAADDDDGA